MKKSRSKLFLSFVIVVVVSFLFVIIGCRGGRQENSSLRSGSEELVKITHALGTVKVVKNPQRVVVLDYSELENLEYLGIKPVGVPKSNLPSHLSKYKDDTTVIDVGSITEINLERVNEARPDLIIIGNRLIDFYDQLSVISPVIYPTSVVTEDFMVAFESNLDDLALLFDMQDEIDNAKSEIRSKIENVRSLTGTSDDKALILLHNRGRFSAYGKGSRFGIVHDVLNVAEAAEGLSVHRHGSPVSSEFIQKANPDIIFIVDRSRVVDNEVTNIDEIENILIKGTNAAKNERIYYLNPEIWYLSGSGVESVNVMLDEIEQAFLK